MSEKIYTASIIIIGNEILSGRTVDINTPWIAERLCKMGIVLKEVRIIPDEKNVIIDSVIGMKDGVDYVFSTGGIGPTHDDITTLSVAKAFGVGVYLDDDARNSLKENYGDDLTEARLKMAYLPEGCKLIDNPVSGAPGFIMENVYVMAGVPRIMRAMFDGISSSLQGGRPLLSNTIVCGLQESVVAEKLSCMDKQFDDVEIGSYPHYRGGSLGLSLVLRSSDDESLNTATYALIDMIKEFGDKPRAVGIQSSLTFEDCIK